MKLRYSVILLKNNAILLFFISLPRSIQKAKAMELENSTNDYRPLILVAEDDESNFKLIKAIIGKKCEIMWAKNGEEIVSLFKENREKAEAILMDIKMPIMNGLDATEHIRQEEKRLPIIMQTAYAFTADRERALECGASEVLVKPITMNALRTCLSRYLPKLMWQ